MRWSVRLIACSAAGALLVGGCGDAAPSPANPTVQPQDVTGPTLVAAGDVACAPKARRTSRTCRQRETAALIATLDPDVVAPLGDLQYETGTPREFRLSFGRTWGRFKRRMHPAVGNHEYFSSPVAAGYFDYFGRRAGRAGEGWYAYDLGSWHVAVLNANCEYVGCAAGSPQERWLRADLAENPRRCTLAYWHQPRFSSGLHGSSTDMLAIWRVLERAGAEIVLSGHDHSYERFLPQTASGHLDRTHGIVQWVVGTGGASQYPIVNVTANSRVHETDVFGLLELTLGEGNYAWRFMPAAGSPSFHDAGAASCHGTLASAP